MISLLCLLWFFNGTENSRDFLDQIRVISIKENRFFEKRVKQERHYFDENNDGVSKFTEYKRISFSRTNQIAIIGKHETLDEEKWGLFVLNADMSLKLMDNNHLAKNKFSRALKSNNISLLWSPNNNIWLCHDKMLYIVDPTEGLQKIWDLATEIGDRKAYLIKTNSGYPIVWSPSNGVYQFAGKDKLIQTFSFRNYESKKDLFGKTRIQFKNKRYTNVEVVNNGQFFLLRQGYYERTSEYYREPCDNPDGYLLNAKGEAILTLSRSNTIYEFDQTRPVLHAYSEKLKKLISFDLNQRKIISEMYLELPGSSKKIHIHKDSSHLSALLRGWSSGGPYTAIFLIDLNSGSIVKKTSLGRKGIRHVFWIDDFAIFQQNKKIKFIDPQGSLLKADIELEHKKSLWKLYYKGLQVFPNGSLLKCNTSF